MQAGPLSKEDFNAAQAAQAEQAEKAKLAVIVHFSAELEEEGKREQNFRMSFFYLLVCMCVNTMVPTVYSKFVGGDTVAEEVCVEKHEALDRAALMVLCVQSLGYAWILSRLYGTTSYFPKQFTPFSRYVSMLRCAYNLLALYAVLACTWHWGDHDWRNSWAQDNWTYLIVACVAYLFKKWPWYLVTFVATTTWNILGFVAGTMFFEFTTSSLWGCFYECSLEKMCLAVFAFRFIGVYDYFLIYGAVRILCGVCMRWRKGESFCLSTKLKDWWTKLLFSYSGKAQWPDEIIEKEISFTFHFNAWRKTKWTKKRIFLDVAPRFLFVAATLWSFITSTWPPTLSEVTQEYATPRQLYLAAGAAYVMSSWVYYRYFLENESSSKSDPPEQHWWSKEQLNQMHIRRKKCAQQILDLIVQIGVLVCALFWCSYAFSYVFSSLSYWWFGADYFVEEDPDQHIIYFWDACWAGLIRSRWLR